MKIKQSNTEFSFECRDKEDNLFWLSFESTDKGLTISLDHMCLDYPFEVIPDKTNLNGLKQFINTFN